MTDRIVAFTFTIGDQAQTKIPEIRVSKVTLGGKTVESATAQKVSAVLTEMIEKLLPKLQSKNPDHYKRLIDSKQFTVLTEMPNDDKKFSINIVNEAGVDIVLPLSQPHADLLNIRSLAQRAAVSTPSKPLDRIPSSVSKKMSRANNPTRPINATSVPPESHCLLYRIFAAIGNFFKRFFSSQSDPMRSPLIPKDQRTPTPHAAPDQTDSAPSAPIDGIRPLRNGNNICFINAVFQALMNIPELIPVIIDAHKGKIAQERTRIEDVNALIAVAQSEVDDFKRQINDLTKDYSWYQHLLPDAQYSAIIAAMQEPLDRLSDQRRERRNLKNSITASRTLIAACEAYTDGSDPVWLKPLRGFDPTFGSDSQEDSCQLLERIFEPLNSKLIPLFGEEDLLEPYQPKENESEKYAQALNRKKDVSQLPADNLLRRLEPNPIVRMEIPQETIELQALLNQKFTLQDISSEEDKMSFESEEQKGWYRISKKRLVIETKNQAAPDFLPLQLKRFRVNNDLTLSKVTTQIVLPKENKVTVTVNNKPVTYEIHSILVHNGDSPRGGHYFSYVKKESGWVEANDSLVAPVASLPETVKEEAYMIFLKKAN